MMNERKSNWARRAIIFFVLALILALDLSVINPELSDLSGDSARFLLLAQSLAAGKGYRELEKPLEPPHTEYMPGLPLLLAPLYRLWPDDLRPMKFLIAFFAFSGVVFFYLFLWRENFSACIILALAFGLVPFLFRLQMQILSDFPHLAFLLLGFFWFEKVRARTEQKPFSWIMAGLWFAIAFYFRQLALIGFASGVLVMIWLKDLRRVKLICGYVLGFVVPAAVWYLRNFLVAGAAEPSYGHKLWQARASNPFAGTLSLGGLIARIMRRAAFFSLHLEKDMLLGSDGLALKTIWIVLLLFLLIGFFYELAKRKNIGAIFFLPYLAAVSSWEGWVPRYLLPLLPLAIFFIYRGMELSFNLALRKKDLGRMLPLCVFAVWIIFNLSRSLEMVHFQHTPLPYPPAGLVSEQEAVGLLGVKNFAFYPEALDWRQKGKPYLATKSAAYAHFFAMAEWVKRNLGPEAVVVCRKPTLFAWQSGGKAIQYPAELDADKFLQETKSRHGRYILLEEISPELRPILFDFMQKRPEQFSMVKLIAQTFLLKIN